MKKRVLSLLLCGAMAVTMLVGCGSSSDDKAEATSTPTEEATGTTAPTEGEDETTPTEEAGKTDITLGVLIYKYDDTYISTVRSAIEKYAKEAGVSITLNMQDGQGDQAKQNDQIDILIEQKVDALVVNAVDAGSAQGIADKAKEAGIPAVFFNREPAKEIIESCKGIFIGTTASEAGVMQGDMLADLVEADSKIDLNGDGKIQYLVFKGEPGNPEAEARTEYSVKQAEKRGLVMEAIQDPVVANWMTSEAQIAMEAILAANEGKIEAVFCNNDDMALGVLAALNSAGYNESKDSEKKIPVLGVDATDAAIESITNGKMTGTVKQDGDAMGKAVVAIAANVAQGKDFLEGTEYEMAEDGYSVRIPYAPIQ